LSKTRWFLGYSLTLLFALDYAVLPAQAATFERVPAGILMRGEIEEGDLERFNRAITNHGLQPLLLSSPGGLVKEALQIAAAARSRGMSTHIPGGVTCASACVLVFAGGIVRSADDTARIGVHMGSGLLFNLDAEALMSELYKKYGAKGATYFASRYEQSAAISMLRQVHFYLSAGVSLRLLEVSAKTEHLEMRWLTPAEARDFNLINVR